MTRRFNIFLLALLVVIGLPAYWLLIDNRPGDVAAKPVTIAQLRDLAASIPGNAPSGVEMELVSFRRVPGTLFVAGGGLKRKLVGAMVFRLPVAGGAPVMIDSGLTEKAALAMGFEQFDRAAQGRVEDALRQAGIILITHEHVDHQGGIVALGDRAVFAKTRFNTSQVAPAKWTNLLPWPPGERPVATIEGSAPVAVAPGVVAIPAPSHTPGSQMIFVRLHNGREYLFTGDIATMAQSWQEIRARSRLVGDIIAKEDRGQVYAWLKTIRALKSEAPKLEVIPGHDYESIDFEPGRRGIAKGFAISQN